MFVQTRRDGVDAKAELANFSSQRRSHADQHRLGRDLLEKVSSIIASPSFPVESSSMARPSHIENPDALFSVTSPGNRQEVIFDDYQDRQTVLKVNYFAPK